jgi:tetratricopeptide (TPR) repeat protein
MRRENLMPNRALLVACMSASGALALLSGCSKNDPGGASVGTQSEEQPFWVKFRRPAYSGVPLEEAEAPLLQEIKAAAPDLERAMQEFENEPRDVRNAIPAGLEALTAARVNADYLDYRMLELEAYRAGTKDTGDARAAGEAFLLAYLHAATGQQGAKTQDEIRQLGEAAISKGGRDPLVRAYLARIWMGFGELQSAHDALEEVAAELDGGSYPPNVPLLVRQWLSALARDLKQMDLAILARTYAAIDAAVRFLEVESAQPNQRFVRWQFAPWFRALPEDQQQDFVVACLQSSRISRWQQHMLLGEHLERVAWSARGNGLASTVSEDGWKKFYELLHRATLHYTRAWQIRPEYPEAAAALVFVSHAGRGNDVWSPRNWLQQAVRAQCDYSAAYENYLRVLQPRWGGSYEEMLAFARECAATGRWDTVIPFFTFAVLREVRTELGPEYPLGQVPGAREAALTMQRGMLEQTGRGEPCWGCDGGNWGLLATVLVQAGCYEEARTIFDSAGAELKQADFDEMSAKLSYVRGLACAMTGPARQQVRVFEEALGGPLREDVEAAVFDDLENHLAAAREADSRPEVVPYFDDVEAMARALRAFHDGEWAELPFDENLSGWAVRAGTAEVVADGVLRLTKVDDSARGPRVRPLARFVPPYAVEAEIGPVGRKDNIRPVGVMYGCPESNAVYGPQPMCAVMTGEQPGFVHLYFPWRQEQYQNRGRFYTPRDYYRMSLRIRPGQIEYRVGVSLMATEEEERIGASDLLSFGGFDGDTRPSVVQVRNVRIHKLSREAPPDVKQRDAWRVYYTRELEIDPDDPHTLMKLGLERHYSGEYTRARELMRRAEARNPQIPGLAYFLASSCVHLREYRESLPYYERAVVSQPEFMEAHSNLAWLLATAPFDDLRDGKRALSEAVRACELAEYQKWLPLCSLAAAHAELGQFDEASKWIQKSMELVTDDQREWLVQQQQDIAAGKPLRMKAGSADSLKVTEPETSEAGQSETDK